jgi:N-acetylglutamate synthase-like GNAT family acetyltransferase
MPPVVFFNPAQFACYSRHIRRDFQESAPMPHTPRFRTAQASDAPAIDRLYRQLVSHPGVNVQAGRIAALADDPATRLFVCEQGGAVAGTALVSLCADVMFGRQPYAVVENFVIDDALRGSGLGSALMAHIEAFCLAQDCSKIMLLSSAQREAAHRFFARAGFSGSAKQGFVKYRSALTAGGAHA